MYARQIRSPVGSYYDYDCPRHSHAVQAVRRLFEAVALPQVVVDLAVLHARVRRLAARGDLPHGDAERPLDSKQNNAP